MFESTSTYDLLEIKCRTILSRTKDKSGGYSYFFNYLPSTIERVCFQSSFNKRLIYALNDAVNIQFVFVVWKLLSTFNLSSTTWPKLLTLHCELTSPWVMGRTTNISNANNLSTNVSVKTFVGPNIIKLFFNVYWIQTGLCLLMWFIWAEKAAWFIYWLNRSMSFICRVADLSDLIIFESLDFKNPDVVPI